MRAVRRFAHGIDIINEWVGKYIGYFIIPMVIIVSVDVMLRYVFNKPTIWAMDINVQLLGVLVIIGGGYTLLSGSHIGVDILVVKLSPRKRAVIDLITGWLFFLGVGVLLWKAWVATQISIATDERLTSIMAPPIYPFKMLMVIGIFLLLIQGISKFIRDLDIVLVKSKEGS